MKPLCLAMAQMDPTVGDYQENTAKILDWIDTAEAKGADLIVFPEVALAGYPMWDLANKKRFVAEGLRHLKEIIRSTVHKKVTVVLGFVEPHKRKQGHSYNALAWIEKGELKAKAYKRLLPTYDVFIEDIFFEPGKKSTPIKWRGMKIGPTICEDIWDEEYDAKPLAELSKKGIDLAVNISCSPFYYGVASKRDKHLSQKARKHRVPILYVNQVGAQDDLIFDGRSLLVDEKGKVLFRAPAFKEGLFFYDWKPGEWRLKPDNKRPTESKEKEVYDALVLGVHDYCRKNRFEKVLIGLSGGIDSSLVACIAADALGPQAVLGISMPSQFSSEGSWKDSEELARNLGIEFRVGPIRDLYDAFLAGEKRVDSEDRGDLRTADVTLAMENLQARLRGVQLMYVSNHENRLLLTTGNKSELAVGYCTLYGDMAGGLCVIGDVYKTDVYRLARYRNTFGEVIPERVLSKAPSAELRPDQTDQDSLPPYEELDEILYLYIEKNLSVDEIKVKLKRKNVSPSLIETFIRKVDHNEYKRRQTPPVLRVTEKSWFGRRMPITNRFEN